MQIKVFKPNFHIIGKHHICISNFREGNNRPFPHYAPVSKHKEMRMRLGLTISYKSLYFVQLSLELVPLITGMQERSIGLKCTGHM